MEKFDLDRFNELLPQIPTSDLAGASGMIEHELLKRERLDLEMLESQIKISQRGQKFSQTAWRSKRLIHMAEINNPRQNMIGVAVSSDPNDKVLNYSLAYTKGLAQVCGHEFVLLSADTSMGMRSLRHLITYLLRTHGLQGAVNAALSCDTNSRLRGGIITHPESKVVESYQLRHVPRVRLLSAVPDNGTGSDGVVLEDVNPDAGYLQVLYADQTGIFPGQLGYQQVSPLRRQLPIT